MRIKKSFCATEFGDVYCWQTGSGPVLLLLHQASQSSEEYAAIAPHLAERYTVLAIDYPGHGRSDDPDVELSVQDFSSVVIEVLDELGLDRVHVCGHHSGAVLAIDLAVNHSKRIDKVILSGIGIRTETAVRAILDTPMTRDLPIDPDGDYLAKTWNVYRRMSSPGVSPEVTFKSFIVGLEARRRPFDAHIAVLKWDRDPLLEHIDKPTLIMCGEFDHFAEKPEKLLELIGDSQITYIRGGGPFLFHEKPRECASAIIGFLDK